MARSADKRGQYRVAEPLQTLRMLVADESGDVPVHVLDVSAGGAAISLRAAALPLESGRELRLRFVDDRRDIRFDMIATVRHLREDDADLTAGLQFHDIARLERHLPADMFKVFNRRRSFRVRPPVGERIAVSVERTEDGVSLQMLLADISADGLGGWFADARCETFAVEDTVTLSFTLPGFGRPLNLGAVLVALSATADAWRAGFNFDEKTPGFLGQQNTVTDYVMRRQHEQLRAAG